MSNYLPILPALSLAVTLITAAYVLSSRRNTPLSQAYLLFLTSIAGFTFFELLMLFPAFSADTALLFKFAGPFANSLGFTFLLFIYRLIDRPLDRIIYWSGAITAVVVYLATFTDLLIYDAVLYPFGGADIRNKGYHLASNIPNLLSGAYGLFLLLRARRTETRTAQRRVMLLMLWGGTTTLSGFFILNIFIPGVLHIPDFPRYGTSTGITFVVASVFAVRRHSFLSISLDQISNELFDHFSEAVLLVHGNGTIERLNQKAKELFFSQQPVPENLALISLIGTPMIDAFNTSTHLDVVIAGASKTLGITRYTLPHFRHDGKFMLIFSDETEKIRARAVLRRHRDELEKEIRIRTLRTRQSQRLNALATITAGIAHDFNGLLNTIMGFATAAREELRPEHPVREDMEEIIAASKRAGDLIRQMMTLSAKESAPPSTLELSALIAEALRLLNYPLGVNIISCREPLWVKGHLTRLHQAIMNLLVNAQHAMKESGGTLTIETRLLESNAPISCVNAELGPGPWAVVNITDEGRGISPENLSRIFEPFFTTRKQEHGTGLGLSTVFQVVEEHGGGLQVETELNRGSTFRLLLPAVSPPQLQPAQKKPAAIPAGHGRVLVVDDQEAVGRVLKRLLEPAGYSVETTRQPQQALEILRANPSAFDAVITDYAMPALTGNELARALNAIRPELPVILISGKAHAIPDPDRALFCAYLVKPVDREVLLQTLHSVLQNPKRGAP